MNHTQEAAMITAEVQYAQNTGVTGQLQEFPQEYDVVK